jgi:hypothetical protein
MCNIWLCILLAMVTGRTDHFCILIIFAFSTFASNLLRDAAVVTWIVPQISAIFLFSNLLLLMKPSRRLGQFSMTM